METLDQIESRLDGMVDVLIDKDNLLEYADPDTGERHDGGWRPEERQFCPDGGTGPWPAAVVLRTRSEELASSNPAKSAEYRDIFNALTLRALELIKYLFASLSLDILSQKLEQSLVEKEGPLAERLAALDNQTVQSLKEVLISALSSGGTCQTDPTEPCGYMGYITPIPVFMEGARYYTGADTVRVRVKCRAYMNTLALLAGIGTWELLRSANADQREDEGENLRNAADRFDLGSPYELLMAGALAGKYCILWGRRSGNRFYIELGKTVVGELDRFARNLPELETSPSAPYYYGQLLEATALAYEEGGPDSYGEYAKTVLMETLNWENLETENAEGEPTATGIYDTWANDAMSCMTSYHWVIQLALIKWHHLLTGEDPDTADEMKKRAVEIFRFMMNFNYSSTTRYMDHDFTIVRTEEGDGKYRYRVPEESRNRGYYEIGCIQCSFAACHNYLYLTKREAASNGLREEVRRRFASLGK